MTCVNCLQARADIAERLLTSNCFVVDGVYDIAAARRPMSPASRVRNSAIYLKRVRGLKQARVADAAWIWTEPTPCD